MFIFLCRPEQDATDCSTFFTTRPETDRASSVWPSFRHFKSSALIRDQLSHVSFTDHGRQGKRLPEQCETVISKSTSNVTVIAVAASVFSSQCVISHLQFFLTSRGAKRSAAVGKYQCMGTCVYYPSFKILLFVHQCISFLAAKDVRILKFQILNITKQSEGQSEDRKSLFYFTCMVCIITQAHFGIAGLCSPRQNPPSTSQNSPKNGRKWVAIAPKVRQGHQCVQTEI